MANTFQIANANPIRLVKQVVSDQFLLKPFDLKQDSKCYFQKYNTADVINLQILSDFDDIAFNVYDLYTNQLRYSFPAVDTETNIIGQTFKCYEIAVQFDLEGDYYCELTYTDDVPQQVLYQSEPIEVKSVHEGTMLIEYKNSENNFAVIFDTNIIFRLRVEGTITEFKPEYEEIVYNDQQKNATKLYAVPFRSFKLYIGNASGVPDWMADKVNSALVCDTVQIEGEYYERIEGSKWEVNRADPNGTPFAGWSTEIMPVANIFLQRIKTGEEPPKGFTVVEKVKNYFSNGANLTVSGIFKKYTLLKHISIINYGSDFTLTIGVTPGGNELGVFSISEFAISGEDHDIELDNIFRSISTVYLTGLTGTNADILINYLQYDELPTAGIDVPTAPSFPIGFQGFYHTVTGRDINLDWNLATGLGIAGAPYANCAICDGRNGTTDMRDRFIRSLGTFTTIGQTGGQKQFTIEMDNLPSDNVLLPVKGTGGDWKTSGGSGYPTTPTAGTDGLHINLGSDEPIIFIPEFIVLLPFLAIS